MAYPTIIEAAGALSATGIAKETTFGVPVLPSTFLPMTSNTMNVDPGWFSPELMMGVRDKQIYNLQGEEHNVGAVDGPLFPSNAMELLVASIGADNVVGAGITGTAGTGSTTLASGPSAGASTITVGSATGFATGQVVQIDINGTGPVTTAECRKITVSGTTFTLDQPLTYAHLSSATVVGVIAPYTHTIQQANTLPSLTVEKNIGGRQSLQFAGCRVNKFDLKAPDGNEPAAITADLMGQSVTPLTTPSAVSVTNEMPFVFTEAAVNFYGSQRFESKNLAVSIDNALKETYTYSGQHGPSFITPISVHVSGTLDMVWSSLTDATYGDFNRMYNQTLGALTTTLAHPASGGSITISLPQVALSKYAADQKFGDIVLSSLTWEASRPQTGSSLFTVQAVVVNNVYLGY